MNYSPQHKVLVIDDDAKTLGLLESILARTGFQVITASSGVEGLRKLYHYRPQLILLDVVMPEMDGWQTYSYIRELSDLPVIFISSTPNADDLTRSLQLGALDYLSKPLQADLLIASIKAVLHNVPPAATFDPAAMYHDEHLTIDPVHKRVYVQDQEVPLTTHERNLLFFLFQQAGSICTFEQILKHVWGWEYRESTQYVHVYIAQLRRKIEPNPKHPRYIITEHRKGYWFKK